MSNIFETLKEVLEEELTSTSLEVYSCELNENTFGGIAEVHLDYDGDLKISLTITDEELCDHIPPDVMKEYLIEEGYLEEEV